MEQYNSQFDTFPKWHLLSRCQNSTTCQVDCSPRSKINKQRVHRTLTHACKHSVDVTRFFISDMVNEHANWAGDGLLFPFHSKLSHLPQMHFRIRQALSYFSARAFKPFQWQEVVIIAWVGQCRLQIGPSGPRADAPTITARGHTQQRVCASCNAARKPPRKSRQRKNFCSVERPGATPALVRSQKNPSDAFLS